MKKRYLVNILGLIASIFAMSLSGCIGLKTFPQAARGGDTVALAVGSADGMARANTSAIYVSDSAPSTPISLTSGIRGIFKLYADKASSLYNSGSNVHYVIDTSGHEPWVTVMVVDLPQGLPTGSGQVRITTTATYPTIGSHINNRPISLVILPGTGTKVLGFGYDASEVARQLAAFRQTVTAPAYPSAQVRSQVTPAALHGEITELDALVAYLQKLGRDLKAARKSVAGPAAAEAAESKNPYAGNRGAEEEGEKIFKENCRSCHGEKGAGGFGPKLATTAHKYGGSDAELFASVAGGRPGGMPAFLPQLGKDRVWKAIAYIRHLEREGR